ncbi:uncharacterized protein LOC142168694 [Nicotiana tabacum]|uniref:Uncharacterized protein LOC142168694 n=1 Tax=Nicotiana tabacum TaxID=4097 RepID=A0AC58SKJ3_TOBAC|nr:uncharacterized protein LOC104113459 [Nicotiana tomentosiformis]
MGRCAPEHCIIHFWSWWSQFSSIFCQCTCYSIALSKYVTYRVQSHKLQSEKIWRNKDNNQNISGGSKTNARATSVPRPRAVLSSPDNDQMIRTRGKTKAELISGLKSHNLCQNRHHTRCKTFPKSIQAENPISGNKGSKETADAKLDPRPRGGLVKADQSEKTHLHKGDQDSVSSK